MKHIRSLFKKTGKKKDQIRTGTTHGVNSIEGREVLLDYLVRRYSFKTVLDIGCGVGDFFHYLKQRNLDVSGYGIDMVDPKDVLSINNFTYHKLDFNRYIPDRQFDLVFSSHTVEHNANTELFLRKMMSCVKEGGIFCLIWPPPKPEIVGGHVHMFNMGLMLYNLVRIGVNCRNIEMLQSGYNLAILGYYKPFALPELTHNRFEIQLLEDFFPFPATQGFNGDEPPGLKHLKE
jgi:SAM-dependent methyltransferase